MKSFAFVPDNVLPKIFSSSEILGLSLVVLVASVAASVLVHPVAGVGLAVASIVFVLLIHAPWVGVVLIAFLLPFERIGGYEGLGFTIRPSQIVLILTILAWGFVWLRHRDARSHILRRNPATLPLLGFLAVNAAGLVLTPNIERSIAVFAYTIFTMSLAWMIPALLSNASRIRVVLIALLVTTTLVCVFGIFQFLGDMAGLPETITGLREHYTRAVFGFPRVQSTSLEPLYFANFLLLPIALAVSLIMERQYIVRPWMLWGVLGLACVNVILTVSRGGYLALFALAIGLGIFYIRRFLNGKVLFGIVGALAIVGIMAFQFLGFQDALQRNREVFVEHVVNVFSGASYVERVNTIETAINMFSQSPLIGYGPGSFGPFASYHPAIQPGSGWAIVNNETIELLAETGLLGAFAIAMLGVVLLVRSWREVFNAPPSMLRAAVVAATVTLVAYVVQYQTFSILYIMHIWFTVGLLIAIQHHLKHT